MQDPIFREIGNEIISVTARMQQDGWRLPTIFYFF